MFFQCNIKTDMSTLETWGSAMMDLRNRLVDFQTQTDKIVDLLSLRNSPANHSSHSDHAQAIANPSLASPNSVVNSQQAVDEDHYTFHPLTDSELQRCTGLNIPSLDQMPSILLPPETTGQE